MGYKNIYGWYVVLYVFIKYFFREEEILSLCFKFLDGVFLVNLKMIFNIRSSLKLKGLVVVVKLDEINKLFCCVYNCLVFCLEKGSFNSFF